MPNSFESKGSFRFSNFLNLDSHRLAPLDPKLDVGKSNVFRRAIKRLFGGSETEHERYQSAIREINRQRDEKGDPNERAMEIGGGLQRYERQKLGQTLREMREHYAYYSPVSLESFQETEQSYIHRIATEDASIFVAGLGYIFAFLPWKRCSQLPHLAAKHNTELDGEKIVGLVNLVEYEEIVRLENRNTRLQRDYRVDRELLENYFELNREGQEVQVFLRELYWSYKPEERRTKVATLPVDADADAIRAAMQKVLRDERYFSVCECCWQRKPRGVMMVDADTCRSCKEPDHKDNGVVY